MKAIVVALALLALPLLAGDQSMGEAARKARERREKNAKEGVKAKSYTQDDVKNAPPLANDPNKPAASSGPPPSTPSSAGGSSSPVGSSASGQSEAAWRGRIAGARQRVSDTRKEYEYWNSSTMVPGEILVDEKDRPVITSIAQLQSKTAAARKAMDGAEQALVNLEEEARRTGVPPGWLR